MKIKYIKFKALSIIFAILLANSFVVSQTKFTEQKAGNIIFLSVPSYMVKTNTLNDSAILQYMNATKEAYLVVLDDSKEELESLGKKFETATEFLESIIKPLEEGLKKGGQTDKKTFEIGTTKYSQSTLSGYFTNSSGDEFEVIYLITCLETPKNFYQILCWSTKENYNGLVSDFDKISKSLKEDDCK